MQLIFLEQFIFCSEGRATLTKISPEKLQEIKSKVDLVEAVSYYVPTLKRTGRTFSACCPFHQEKTPSFHLYPEKQFFKCFGCGFSGDVILFIRRIEKLEFMEAVRLLAERMHIPLEEETSTTAPPQFERQELFQLMRWATSWFQSKLHSKEGLAALQYLQNRKISEGMIEKFQLGYAPGGWTLFMETAQRQKISMTLLETAGFVKKNAKGNYHDFFCDRVMFPIWNATNEVVAFGGRTLDPAAKQFKYLNSPETPLFQKNKILYGLNFAKEDTKSKRQLILMEGYTDVILCHQGGITSSVAPLGTSLTDNHLKLAKRYADQLILLFDGDSAGKKAGERATPMVLNHHFKASVVVLPEGEDPYDFILHRGVEELQAKLQHTQSLFDFKIAQVRERHQEMKAPEDLLAGLNELQQFVSEISVPLVREVWMKEICQLFQIDPKTFKPRKIFFKPASTSVPTDSSRLEPSEKFILRTCFFQPEFLKEVVARVCSEELFSHLLKNMLTQLNNVYRPNQKIFLEQVICQAQEDPIKELWIQLVQEEDFSEMSSTAVQGHLEQLCIRYNLPKLNKLVSLVKDENQSSPLNSNLFQQRREQLLEYQKIPKPHFFGLGANNSHKK